MVNPRPFTKLLKRKLAPESIGVEVGVAMGNNAQNILEVCSQIKLLYLVDPYLNYPGYEDQTRRKSIKKNMKQKAKTNMASFEDRIQWIYKRFEDCNKEDFQTPLDFVYIDGNHKYEYVLKDIKLAYAITKSDGLIGGHDWDWPGHKDGIRKAVNEVSTEFGFDINHKDNDWWFIKTTYLRRF